MAKGYVAYADLGGRGSGAPVDPDEYGGVDSEDFKYMLERRTVLPLGDPDVPAPPDEIANSPAHVAKTKKSQAEDAQATADRLKAEYEAAQKAADEAKQSSVDDSMKTDTAEAKADKADPTTRQPGQATPELKSSGATTGSSPGSSSAKPAVASGDKPSG
jgi:hypothetical protein